MARLMVGEATLHAGGVRAVMAQLRSGRIRCGRERDPSDQALARGNPRRPSTCRARAPGPAGFARYTRQPLTLRTMVHTRPSRSPPVAEFDLRVLMKAAQQKPLEIKPGPPPILTKRGADILVQVEKLLDDAAKAADKTSAGEPPKQPAKPVSSSALTFPDSFAAATPGDASAPGKN